MVLGVGYVADRGLTETLKRNLGFTLTESHLQTLIKSAIIGPSSGLLNPADGKAISFNSSLPDGHATIPWKYVHPTVLQERLRAETQDVISSEIDGGAASAAATASPDGGSREKTGGGVGVGDGSGGGSTGNNDNNNPTLIFLHALIAKMSDTTMMALDEVEADAPLSKYGLDTLIAIELWNWIRRETGVEMSLNTLTHAKNLRALATLVFERKK